MLGQPIEHKINWVREYQDKNDPSKRLAWTPHEEVHRSAPEKVYAEGWRSPLKADSKWWWRMFPSGTKDWITSWALWRRHSRKMWLVEESSVVLLRG